MPKWLLELANKRLEMILASVQLGIACHTIGRLSLFTGRGASLIGDAAVRRPQPWLPFEGQGVISTWNLSLDPRDNNFDFTTITDVILHVRYTARGAGDKAAADIVRQALKPTDPRSILVSARNMFPNWYYKFLNPDSTATEQDLTLPLSNAVFPYTNLANSTAQIQDIDFYFVLSQQAKATTLKASLKAPPISLTLTLGNGQYLGDPANPVSGLALAAPQTFTVTVAEEDVVASGLGITVDGHTRLDPFQVEDVLLVVTYSIV